MARHYRQKGFVVAAQDEAIFGLIPIISRGWAVRGSRPVANMNFRHDCINVLGARSQKAFVFSFCKRKNKRRFVRFLTLLLRRWGRVFLIIDNAPWHGGKEVQEFLQRHSKTFKILYLPRRTPELNPVEQCWKPARRSLANRLLRTLPAAQYHLRKTFGNPILLPRMFRYLSN